MTPERRRQIITRLREYVEEEGNAYNAREVADSIVPIARLVQAVTNVLLDDDFWELLGDDT